RAEVIPVLIESGWQVLEIVSRTQVYGELPCARPMILYKSTETRDRKIHMRAPESLSKLIRIRCEKIRQRTEEIYAAEPVRYVGPQSDAINCPAHFPKVFALRARVCVIGLIMIFAALAVSCVRTPEGDQSSDINLRTERFVRAQDSVARGGLEAHIAHSL